MMSCMPRVPAPRGSDNRDGSRADHCRLSGLRGCRVTAAILARFLQVVAVCRWRRWPHLRNVEEVPGGDWLSLFLFGVAILTFAVMWTPLDSASTPLGSSSWLGLLGSLLSALFGAASHLGAGVGPWPWGTGGRRASDRAGILATRYAAGAVRLRLVQAEQLWVVASDGNRR